MRPPKYEFYIGTAQKDIIIWPGLAPNGLFDFVLAGDETFCTGPIELNSNELIFLNLNLTDPLNMLLFFDETYTLIENRFLSNGTEEPITPPEKAKYWRAMFTSLDSDFDAKKQTHFIYKVSTVKPHYKELSKKMSKENEQMFFRSSIEGRILLIGDDYKKVGLANLEEQFIMLIMKQDAASDEWEIYYKGLFGKTDCKIDHSKKRCELKTEPLDQYVDIMANLENTYNLIELQPELTKLYAHKRPLTQIYIGTSNIVANFIGNIRWDSEVSEATDDLTILRDKCHFSFNGTVSGFSITSAGLYEARDYYAGGRNGTWVGKKNGFTFYMDPNNRPGYFFLKDKNGKDIYRSSVKYWYANINDLVALDKVTMARIDFSVDTFSVEDFTSYPVFARVLCDVEQVFDAEEQKWKDTYPISYEDIAMPVRSYRRCIGLTTNLSIVNATASTSKSPTEYGKAPSGEYYTDLFIEGLPANRRPYPVCKDVWGNVSIWHLPDPKWYSQESSFWSFPSFQGMQISAVIKALLKKVAPSLSHEATPEYSEFLYGSNPNSFIGDTFRPGIYITPKSNILRLGADYSAKKAEVSLADITKMLRDCFRCYWFIEDNKLKIEHIRFFMKGGRYGDNDDILFDFTKAIDPYNKKRISYCQSEIEYDKSELPSRYEFGWMDEASDVFTGLTLDVESSYVQKGKTENVNPGKFSSDVDFMIGSPQKVSDDGFALLVLNSLSNMIPMFERTIYDEKGSYTVLSQNWAASWMALQVFYDYDRPALNIKANRYYKDTGGYVDVLDFKRSMSHTIELTMNEDPKETQPIKTIFGDGQIDDVSINIDTRKAKIKLVYVPQ